MALLPEPIGYLGGSAVFTEQAIMEFGVAAGFIEPGDHKLTGEWIPAPPPVQTPAPGYANAYGPADDELF
ncbi:hypothetical protein B5P43_15680 [Bacillus sp. SRB_336]|nr:hypothetical protein B5P43_15680 [Bacillus sp. SRB_336]